MGKDCAENVKAGGQRDAVAAMDGVYSHMEHLVKEKESSQAPKSKHELLSIFVTYFSPNLSFYSRPGSQKYQAYFGAINAAKLEMLKNPELYAHATKRSQSELLDMLNNPEPIITNMLICALIFSVGEYAVIKDALYCVDFSEHIPNCIALYLLLTAQKQPADKRKQLIDAGDGTDPILLQKAVEALAVCDPNWKCIIM